ncbi:hypothetical protein C8F01DRAFT_1140756 [Mycena amicta]|nr:hypothetical protein C8F01DRAFT_1140756 [Mycena amicta]
MHFTGPRFPNELRLEVLKHLPPHHLLPISLANRTFSQLATPLLFADLQFIPYDMKNWARITQIRLPSPERVAAFTQRLDFVASDRIAPVVRAIHIDIVGRADPRREYVEDREPWVYPDESDLESESDSYGDVHSLLYLLLSRLERFTGLRTFTAKQVSMTTDAITSLARISQLPGHLGIAMSIINCSFLGNTALLPSLPAECLHLTSFTLATEDEKRLGTHWMPLLAPHLLRAVDLGNAWLHELNLAALPVFPSVTHLAINLTRLSDHHARLWSAIAKFPAVQVLNLKLVPHDDEVFVPLNLPPFPALREFTGAPPFAAGFVPGTALTRLELVHPSTPAEIIAALANLSLSPTIEDLSLVFRIPATAALADSDYDPIGPIFALFPNVKVLDLRYIVSSVQQLLTHFDTLHEILPSLLTSLAVITKYIRVTAGDANEREPGFYPLYDPARLRAQLLTRCLAMTKLRFNGPTFNLQWTKFVENNDRYGPGSRVEESHKSWNLFSPSRLR